MKVHSQIVNSSSTAKELILSKISIYLKVCLSYNAYSDIVLSLVKMQIDFAKHVLQLLHMWVPHGDDIGTFILRRTSFYSTFNHFPLQDALRECLDQWIRTSKLKIFWVFALRHIKTRLLFEWALNVDLSQNKKFDLRLLCLAVSVPQCHKEDLLLVILRWAF